MELAVKVLQVFARLRPTATCDLAGGRREALEPLSKIPDMT